MSFTAEGVIAGECRVVLPVALDERDGRDARETERRGIKDRVAVAGELRVQGVDPDRVAVATRD
ncbi:MAG TPA: hypothetical protein VF001_05400 [Candidatus Limnocylindria bacterium]